jgi:NADH dehydrogenase
MEANGVNIVTGAFSFTGRAIAGRLLQSGKGVRTLTHHSEWAGDFAARITAHPFAFDNPGEIVAAMRGADVLYNTYWIRYEYGSMTFDRAINNSKTLIECARQAGIKRIVHVSVTNASLDSPFPYFRGKAEVEQAVKMSGLSYAILRPALTFGPNDILINNIAWHLRRFPVFSIFGDGDYLVQPVFVEDLGEMAVNCGATGENLTLDCAGPDRFTYEEMVTLIRDKIGRKTRMVHLSPGKAISLTKLSGHMVHDIVLTREEVDALMSNLLVSHNPPTASTRLADWLDTCSATLGMEYRSELERHYEPSVAA